MNTVKQQNYVIGIDYGTDSVRALIVDAHNGNEISSAVTYYNSWGEGKYCDPLKNQFRQHPLDYIESLEEAVKSALLDAPKDVWQRCLLDSEWVYSGEQSILR